MKKDFDKWNDKKKNIHEQSPRVFFREAEIWFCHLGENVGFEQDGSGEDFLRPIVIVKKFNNEICWGIPLTSKIKKGFYYHCLKFGANRENSAILSQLKLIDVKRLQYRIGILSKEDFVGLIQKIKGLFP